MTKRISLSVLATLLVALTAVAAFTGCLADTNGNTDPSAVIDIGEGSVVFVLEVTDDSDVITRYNVSTDETTVGAALLEVKLIEGETSDYGLYIKTVGGLTADFDADNAYWAFYVNDGYATSGADTTDIVPNTTYALVYTKG